MEYVKSRLAAVFTDNMVLQANKIIRIFGQAMPGTRIEISLISTTDDLQVLAHASTVTDSDGEFIAELPPLDYADNLTLRMCDGYDETECKNVAIGEVFLAGGQSNMQYIMKNAYEGREFLDSSITEDIRFYQVARSANFDKGFDKREYRTKWHKYDSMIAGDWSAIALFAAKDIAEKLGVCVGIIECDFGGTEAACWIDRLRLIDNAKLAHLVADYEQNEDCKVEYEEQSRLYNSFCMKQAFWDYNADKLRKKHPGISEDEIRAQLGDNDYPGPKNLMSFLRPGGLYETMFKRICPYTLAGVMFYQGESDEAHPDLYKELFRLLIECWREELEDDELPFIFFQLPMFKYADSLDGINWAIIREAQMQISEETDNTGIVVIADLGQYNEIHPVRKKEAGRRLALKVLEIIYDEVSHISASAPVVSNLTYCKNDNTLRLDILMEGSEFSLLDDSSDDIKAMRTSDTFRNDIYGKISEETMRYGFEISVNGSEYIPAAVRFDSKCIILNLSDYKEILRCNLQNEIQNDVQGNIQVRYLYHDYREVYIFGENGIPLAPFCRSAKV